MASSGFQADVRALQKVLAARHLVSDLNHLKFDIAVNFLNIHILQVHADLFVHDCQLKGVKFVF